MSAEAEATIWDDEPECKCAAAGQPIYEGVGVLHTVDCAWLKWFRSWGGCMGDA